MNGKAKTNSIVTHRQIASTALGFTVKGYPEFSFDMTKVAAANRIRAELHGWCQRIPDGAAVSRNTPEGGLRTDAEMRQLKHERMLALVEHYESGTEEWSRVSAGGGGKSITLQAVAEISGITYERAEAIAEANAAKRSEDMKTYLAYVRTGPKVQEKIAEMRKRAERPAAVDADEELEAFAAE